MERHHQTELDADTARELVRYDPETGKLFWLERPRMYCATDRTWRVWNKRFAGKEAFTALTGEGYYHGAILDRKYKTHRVAWLLVHGTWPAAQIDHINGVRTDNRLVNLRDVSGTGNAKNTAMRSNNASGVVGVYWRKRTSNWNAQINVSGRNISLGYFSIFEEAVSARRAAEVEYGFHANHGRRPCRTDKIAVTL